jgi:hypothetical protein
LAKWPHVETFARSRRSPRGYPNQLPAALQGNGFSKYNPYSPWGISGGFYYARASFTF